MNDEHTWHVTRDDSTDLGFALSCLIPGAITLDEFKNWIYLVLADSEDFPDYLIELVSLDHKHELISNWREILGFWPASPLSRTEEIGIVGIAYARFPTFRHDSVQRGDAYQALQTSTTLHTRFARSFPSIEIPTHNLTNSHTDHERRVSKWWKSGSVGRPLTIVEIQTLFINRMAAGHRELILKSDTSLTLHLVTNRARVMIMLTDPSGQTGHAIDPNAHGKSSGFVLENGQEDEYTDHDTVKIPDALKLIEHILANGTAPQHNWSVDS